mgnify:CR=1 FL=1
MDSSHELVRGHVGAQVDDVRGVLHHDEVVRGGYVEMDPCPGGVDLESGDVEFGCNPLAESVADAVIGGIDLQSGLEINVGSAVARSVEEHQYPGAVVGVGEGLDLETAVVRVVGDLEVEHPVQHI